MLWLFTDPARMDNVVAAVARLPPGLCGVVFRHDGVAGRAALARGVWRICRERRLAMVMAGAAEGFSGPGRHLRGGRGVQQATIGRWRTASAHGVAEMVRARRNGAGLIFISPAFATRSHLGNEGLGPVRWARLAQRARPGVLALGGIDGATVRRLPRWVAGVGAIGSLLDGG